MAAGLMRSNSKSISLASVAILGSLIFIIPLLASSIFSFKGYAGQGYSFVNYQWFLEQEGFWQSLGQSFKLAVLTGVLNLILMVPTMVFLNLQAKRWRPIVDFICVLPLIIPVVSLAIGAQVSMPEFLQNSEFELVFFFVIISLPFTYRALDTSLSTIALKVLVEASRSLGASWTATILKVIIPSIRSGIIGTLFLSFALSIGEYTITSLLHWDTFPTWTVGAAQQNILGAVAISTFSFIFAIALMAAVALLSHQSKRPKVKS